MNQQVNDASVRGYVFNKSRPIKIGSDVDVFVAAKEDCGNADANGDPDQVAIKLLRAKNGLDRFQRELNCLNALSGNEHIVQPSFEITAEDLAEFPEYQLGYATPYYSVGTLRDLMKDRSEWTDIARVVQLVLKITRGLKAVHQWGITHRDLTPANIFMATEDEPKIGDFGIAKDPGEATLTVSPVGTPYYMAPEQIRDSSKSKPPADLFSLGCILYEFLTAQRPFEGKSLNEILEDIERRRPVWPSVLRPQVDPMLNRICLKLLHKRAEKRLTAEGLEKRLEAWLAQRKRLEEQAPLARKLQHVSFQVGDRLVSLSESSFARGIALMFVLVCPLVAFILAQSAQRMATVEDQEAIIRERRKEVTEIEVKSQATIKYVADESRNRLRRVFLNPALAALDRGDTATAIPGLLEAYMLQPDAKQRTIDSLRLSLALQSCPTITDAWRHGGSVERLYWAAEAGWVISLSSDGTLHTRDLDSNSLVAQPHSNTKSVSVDRAGRWMVTVASRGVKIWRLVMERGNIARTLADGRRDITFAEIDPTGKYVATASDGNIVQVWNVNDLSLVSEPGAHRDTVRSMHFSEDGGLLVTGCGDDHTSRYGEARLFSTATGEELAKESMMHGDDVLSARISPTGNYIATAGYDGLGHLWKLQNDSVAPEPLATLAHSDVVHGITFSSSGRYVVTESADRQVYVYDTATARARALLHENGSVQRAIFSVDESCIVTASNNGTARLLNRETGKMETSPLYHTAAVRALLVIDKDTLVTGDAAGLVRVWKLPAKGRQFAETRLPGSVENIDVSKNGDCVLVAGPVFFTLFDRYGAPQCNVVRLAHRIGSIDLHPYNPVVAVSTLR